MHSEDKAAAVIIWLLAIIAIIGTAAWFIPYSWETIPGFAQFGALAVWFSIVCVVTIVLALRFREGIAAIVCGFCIIVQLLCMIPYLGHGSTELSPKTLEQMAAMSNAEAKPDDRCARIMTLDTDWGGADPSEIVDTVRNQKVEVLALQQANDGLIATLEANGLSDYLPKKIMSAPIDGTYNVIYTMADLHDASATSIDPQNAKYPAATLDFDKKTIRFICVRTVQPNSATSAQWGKSLDAIADWAKNNVTNNDDTPYVVMGDFYATTNHKHFSNILDHNFRDAARVTRSGFQFTWPSDQGVLPAMATYDHILVNSGVNVGNATTVKISGTSHKAVLAVVEPSHLDSSN